MEVKQTKVRFQEPGAQQQQVATSGTSDEPTDSNKANEEKEKEKEKEKVETVNEKVTPTGSPKPGKNATEKGSAGDCLSNQSDAKDGDDDDYEEEEEEPRGAP